MLYFTKTPSSSDAIPPDKLKNSTYTLISMCYDNIAYLNKIDFSALYCTNKAFWLKNRSIIGKTGKILV